MVMLLLCLMIISVEYIFFILGIYFIGKLILYGIFVCFVNVYIGNICNYRIILVLNKYKIVYCKG